MNVPPPDVGRTDRSRRVPSVCCHVTAALDDVESVSTFRSLRLCAGSGSSQTATSLLNSRISFLSGRPMRSGLHRCRGNVHTAEFPKQSPTPSCLPTAVMRSAAKSCCFRPLVRPFPTRIFIRRRESGLGDGTLAKIPIDFCCVRSRPRFRRRSSRAYEAVEAVGP